MRMQAAAYMMREVCLCFEDMRMLTIMIIGLIVIREGINQGIGAC